MEDPVHAMLARIGTAGAREALLELMGAAERAGLTLVVRQSEVLSVEFQDVRPKRNLFSAIANEGHLLFYLRGPALRRRKGLWNEAVVRWGPQEPNSLGEYRIRITDNAGARAVLSWLDEIGAWTDIIHAEGGRRTLPTRTFDGVTAEHLLRAARMLRAGYSEHAFDESTDYDVLFDGARLPPKALFGVAAELALGEPFGPYDFRGGLGTPCFRAIEAAGYAIVPKGAPERLDDGLADEDRRWAEGAPKLVMHLRRERGAGLATAKRARFRALHGRLCCESCGLDPARSFGEDGEACIEVHHRSVAVAAMDAGHETSLDDLECLCANCHRVEHRRLRQAARIAA